MIIDLARRAVSLARHTLIYNRSILAKQTESGHVFHVRHVATELYRGGLPKLLLKASQHRYNYYLAYIHSYHTELNHRYSTLQLLHDLLADLMEAVLAAFLWANS